MMRCPHSYVQAPKLLPAHLVAVIMFLSWSPPGSSKALGHRKTLTLDLLPQYCCQRHYLPCFFWILLAGIFCWLLCQLKGPSGVPPSCWTSSSLSGSSSISSATNHNVCYKNVLHRLRIWQLEFTLNWQSDRYVAVGLITKTPAKQRSIENKHRRNVRSVGSPYSTLYLSMLHIGLKKQQK